MDVEVKGWEGGFRNLKHHIGYQATVTLQRHLINLATCTVACLHEVDEKSEPLIIRSL